MGIDITINSTTLITLLKTRQNYFDGLFNAVNRVYIYEPLIGQEILKRFDLDILRFFKYLGNRVSLHKIVIAQYYVGFSEAFLAISVDNLVISLFPEKISLM